MADWNRYRHQDNRDDLDRNHRRDRQPEQFQSDRYGEDDSAGGGYGQMGEDYSQTRYASQSDETGYQADRSGFGGRDRDRGFGNAGGDYGATRGSNRQSGGQGNYGAENHRGGNQAGQRENQTYGRGGSYDRGGFGAGSYGLGAYGTDSRRDYADRDRQSGGDRGFFARAGDEVASWFGDDEATRRRESDHSGHGPANYKRSDERVLEDVCDRLTQDWGVDARNVQVTVQSGDVTLDGTVDDRRQKRRAEDVAHDVSGVGNVQNNLRVQQNARPTEGGTDRTQAERAADPLA